LTDSITSGVLAGVQSDIVALMREVDALRTGSARADEKALKEQKQLLLEMLEVLDGFERVFANIEPREETAERQARTWAGNFRTVKKILENHLKSHGVVRIDAPDGVAIPGFHTIVETDPDPGLEDGRILEELQKGYLWQGKVLRAALVRAVKN